jgi:NADH-quinone oxidoreductase subunit I
MVKDLRLFLSGISSSWKGMRLTMAHLRKSGHRKKDQDISNVDYFEKRDGQSTTVYPYEQIPVPDHGRYQLHNEIEDCIVCDKCAKICPVDCIDIEPIKSTEEFGKTSDGTSKRIYAATFDIDMAKCCFCGLCTTVCPTECLTMTPEYDFSVFDLGKLNFGFGNMTEAEAETKRKEWEEAQAKKLAAKAAVAPAEGEAQKPASTGFQPRMRPAMPPKTEEKPKEIPSENQTNIPDTTEISKTLEAEKPVADVVPEPQEKVEITPSAATEPGNETKATAPAQPRLRQRPVIKKSEPEPPENPEPTPNE